MSDSPVNGNSNKPFLIGVAGGTASGKSTVCDRIIEQLGQTDVLASQRKVVCISQDSFYKPLAGPFSTSNNYDHPNALDQDLMQQTLQDVLDGKIVQVPVYDYVSSSIRDGEYLTVYPADVVLVEGILAFYFPTIRELFHMKLFVDTDPDTRLSHRVQRDVNERGRKLDMVLDHYIQFVKPAFEEFCLPTKKFADVIIPRGADNLVAISLIVQHIQDLLWSRNGPDSLSNGSSTRSSTSISQGSNTKRRLVKELSRPH